LFDDPPVGAVGPKFNPEATCIHGMLMKPQKSNHLILPLALLAFLAGNPVAFAQGTAFSDQGRLAAGTNAANGNPKSASLSVGAPSLTVLPATNNTHDAGPLAVVAPPLILSVLHTTSNTVVVSWPVSSVTWQLQASSDATTAVSTWTPCTYHTNGANCVYIESAPTGNRFYVASYEP
jgi:hypothetical protein